jgi:hypothetical protein
MGYYTQYDVNISGIDNANQAVKIAQEYELDDYDVSGDGTKVSANFNTKWYGWKEESIALSRNYPRILIEINGEGEESGDIWKARIRNGVCEIINAKIVFDDFKVVI